jgi:hypothetical protein
MLELALHLLETRRGLRGIHGLQQVPTLSALRLDPRTAQDDGAEPVKMLCPECDTEIETDLPEDLVRALPPGMCPRYAARLLAERTGTTEPKP